MDDPGSKLYLETNKPFLLLSELDILNGLGLNEIQEKDLRSFSNAKVFDFLKTFMF